MADKTRITARAQAALSQFVQLIEHHRKELEHPARLVEKLLAVYIDDLKKQNTHESQDRLQNLEQLVSAIDEYCELTSTPSLSDFLEQIALAQSVDAMDNAQQSVSLMTLHMAKGLEFAHVYMPGMEEGLFPHARSLEDRVELEEERRLCYVGITRAKKQLMLSATRLRVIFGKSNYPDPSRFLTELPHDALDFGETPGDREERASDVILDDPFTPGHFVRHAIFGDGKIIASEGVGERRKLAVQFKAVGRKIIVAKFLEPLDKAGIAAP
jgi:DNA helicase-2/ATP-dependent DNA helicase PcrA